MAAAREDGALPSILGASGSCAVLEEPIRATLPSGLAIQTVSVRAGSEADNLPAQTVFQVTSPALVRAITWFSPDGGQTKLLKHNHTFADADAAACAGDLAKVVNAASGLGITATAQGDTVTLTGAGGARRADDRSDGRGGARRGRRLVRSCAGCGGSGMRAPEEGERAVVAVGAVGEAGAGGAARLARARTHAPPDVTGDGASARAAGRRAAEGAAAVHRRRVLTLAVLCVALVASCALSLSLGRYDLDFGQVLAFFTAPFTGAEVKDADVNVFFTIRLPRVAAALIIGAALSGAGCAFGIFRNPMVSPDLLGASAGACFGAATGILLSFGSVGMELAAFVMGVVAVAASYALSSVLGRRMGGILVLVLSGLVVGNLFQVSPRR